MFRSIQRSREDCESGKIFKRFQNFENFYELSRKTKQPIPLFSHFYIQVTAVAKYDDWRCEGYYNETDMPTELR